MIEAINPARLTRRFIVEHVFVHAGYREYGNCNSDAVNATAVAEDADGAATQIRSALSLQQSKLKSKRKEIEK